MLKNRKFLSLLIVLILFIILTVVTNFSVIKNSFSVIYNITFNKNIDLKKTDDSINILLLGIGGGVHEGPDLSDTIIFANIKPSKNEINIISIPRDLWISDLNSKINEAYAFGEEKEKKGIILSSSVVEKVMGKQVDYTVVLNFSAFEELIDLLGGIDVQVQKTLNDPQYPIEGKEKDLCGHEEEEVAFLATASSMLESFPCRFNILYVEKGLNHMDGITALAFARSRHALSDEGTDFARSNRQHLVILAIKDKVLSLGTIFNPMKVFGIYNVLKDNINTNIKTEEFDDFIKLAQKMQNAKINNYVIDTGDSRENRYGLLVNPMPSEDYKNLWVLIPRVGNNNFSEIQKYTDCVTSGKKCLITERGIEEEK